MSFGESVTILRPTVTGVDDEQGNPIPGPDEVILSDGWAVAPLTASEDSLATGQQVIVGYTIYRRDSWVEVRPDDRVRVRGEVFAVESPANLWVNPGSGHRGTVVTVRRVG